MDKKTRFKELFIHIALLVIGSGIFGLLFQWITDVGRFSSGFLAAFVIFLLCAILLYASWRFSGKRKSMAWMIIVAFLLRLAFGIFLSWGLPQFGYEEPPQQAGFVFKDAFNREASAWELAQSEKSLTTAFSDDYSGDQYGGLLAMSAFVYRYVSPDAYRPTLTVILSAAVMAMSLPFLVSIMQSSFDRKAALWGGWILALYPEGLLLGASQMREPFLILFFTIMTWGAVGWLERRRLKLTIALFIGSTISLFLFSYKVGIPLLGIILVLIWWMESLRIEKIWIKSVVWFAILAITGIFIWLNRALVQEIISWDALVTLRASGRIQYELESIPTWLHFPFIVIYGIFQPVLPAAIAAPAPWIWRVLGICRALGWYALLPLLGYSIVRILKISPSRKKRLLTFVMLSVLFWVMIASLRAGGDQWDNPRYRTIMLPWMAMVSGWVVHLVRTTKDHWFVRVLLVEGIFLGFFTAWYLGRYYHILPRLGFIKMIGLIILLSCIVIIFGWLKDRKRITENGKPEK